MMLTRGGLCEAETLTVQELPVQHTERTCRTALYDAVIKQVLSSPTTTDAAVRLHCDDPVTRRAPEENKKKKKTGHTPVRIEPVRDH
jgi:hypothetical protein